MSESNDKKRSAPPCLYFVVPCYNDEDTLKVTAPVFSKKLRSLIENGTVKENSRVLLINDGSTDGTLEEIHRQKETFPLIIGMDLAFNSGEENALLAGMIYAAEKADCVITMDSDLQDDIDAVDEMLKKYVDGSEIVYGIRSDRDNDPFTERLASKAFYTLMSVVGTGLKKEHANYRLMSKKAVDLLKANLNKNFYLPCFVSRMEMTSDKVYHKRLPRSAGTSGYSISKKVKLAFNAVICHSDLPLYALGTASTALTAAALISTALKTEAVFRSGHRLFKFDSVETAWITAASFSNLLYLVLCLVYGKKRAPVLEPRYIIKGIIE